MKEMKDFIVKRTGNLEDPNSGDIYTTFENPNKELKARIAAFNPVITTYKCFYPSAEWLIGELEDGQYKCTNGKNIHYFDKEEIDEYIVDEKLRLLNAEFLAYKYFKDCFGILSSQYIADKDKWITIKKIDLTSSMGLLGGEPSSTTDVQFYGTFNEYSLHMWDDIELKKEDGRGRILNLYFDFDGNFVNRDYNERLQDYMCGDISIDILAKKLMERVLTFEPYGIDENGEYFLYSKNKYFSKTHCYVFNGYSIEIAPVRHDEISYRSNSRGSKINKLPKKIIKKTREEFLMNVKSWFEENLNKEETDD